MSRPMRALRRDVRGITVVEFGILAPVLGLLLMGAFDIAHTLYMRAVLQGIVQKTARDSGLESGTDLTVQQSLDTKVRQSVRSIANNAKVDISRRFYRTYEKAAAKKAEPFTDLNHDNTCNNGEPFTDQNLNGTWDRDGGDAGQGAARDRTLYTVTVKYPQIMPLYKIIGGPNQVSLAASTILENQPYSDQNQYGAAKPGNCT